MYIRFSTIWNNWSFRRSVVLSTQSSLGNSFGLRLNNDKLNPLKYLRGSPRGLDLSANRTCALLSLQASNVGTLGITAVDSSLYMNLLGHRDIEKHSDLHPTRQL